MILDFLKTLMVMPLEDYSTLLQKIIAKRSLAEHMQSVILISKVVGSMTIADLMQSVSMTQVLQRGTNVKVSLY